MHVKIGCAAGVLLLAQVATAQVLATGGRYAIQTANLAATLAEAGLPVQETRLHLPGPLSAHTEAPALKVTAAQQRLSGEGLACATESEVSCCYAVQDKVWVDGPDAEPWEIYTVLADAEMPAGQLRTADPQSDPLCCSSAPESAARCC